ncbi:DoxX family protein [Microbacterium gorillae]|uniref:DoxX family protein n=1 Tax=Microbacterium gorillae TaxID=1231063 RepID=UPI00058FE3D2|nr:DoxX family protein [Microbacterium gorillae]
MLIALWILNIVLALAFLAVGGMKLLKSKDALLAGGMGWVRNAHPAVVKLVGALEVLGAIGLIAPLATGIAPILTPLAAVGLALTMVGAIITHVSMKDPAKATLVPAVLGVLAIVSAILGFLTLG